jgi:dTDP-4-amino-4,6-dideoxygalactose transaminase
MHVPLLDLRRQNEPIRDELLDAFRRVLDSGQFILGKEVEQFESAAAAVAGARFAIGVTSGTDALLLALMALGIGPGHEVICPSFTFFATAGSVARLGARPVFVDSLDDTFNLDPAGVERSITPRTRAIIPVHLFGQAADMDEIAEIATRHRLPVTEDVAQAFGAAYRGRPLGALGDFGTVSFFPTKNLGALGDAGLLVTNDAALAEKARLLRNHGAHPKYYHKMVGGNFRIDAVQAALLGVKLPHLGRYTELRQQHACHYERELRRFDGKGAVELHLPARLEDRTHIVNQYTIRVRRGPRWQRPESPRDALRRFLTERGIGSEIYYPVPLHAQECFRDLGPQPRLPVCEQMAAEVVSLPVFPEMTAEEQATVIEAVGEFVEEGPATLKIGR